MSIALLVGSIVQAADSEQNVNADGTPVLPELLDAERSFQIAKAAAAAGDFQTAIVALERVLLINPTLGNIKLELGLLYRNVGALSRAKYYMEESLKDDSMPAEVRSKAMKELDALDAVDNASRGQYFASLGTRLQYDSNASGESDFKQLNLGDAFGGINISPTNRDDLGADVSLHVNASGGYRHRFGQDGAVIWQSILSASASRYDEFTDENSESLSLNTRVTVPVNSGLSDGVEVSYSPFVRVTQTFEDGSDDGSSATVGVSLNKSENDYTSGVTLQATEDDGDYTSSFNSTVRFRVSGVTTSQFGISVGNRNAQQGADSYDSFGLSFALSRRYKAMALQRPINATVSTSLARVGYDDVNALLDPVQVRVDEISSVSLTIDIPAFDVVSLTTGLRYTNNGSSLENYKYTNTQVSLGVRWRF